MRAPWMLLAAAALGAPPDYTEIRPILDASCGACHNATVRQAGLDLSTRDKMLRGGDRGPAVVPGDPAASLLLAYVKHERKPGMPMGAKPLAPDVIARIEAWIRAGAPEKAATADAPTHWSFRAPARPAVPKPKDAAWRANPVDAFAGAEHDRLGLRPLGEADRHTLLRRVHLDLTGLPPTPAQVAAFVSDRAPEAYERVVDGLLASKPYGERWGRHWMDVWRYSDWYGSGAEVRSSQRHIWRWRDWIIDSLNADKGYDRMVVEMLAADEAAPGDEKTLAATGFLARNWFRFNRNVWLVDTVEAATSAFLGVTLKCARCHDHKYDPFSQQEYYRFRAFFEPHDIRIDRVPGQPDLKKDGLPRAYDSEPKDAGADSEGGINLMPAIFAKTYLFIRGDENNPDKELEITPGTPRALGGPAVAIAPVELTADSYYPDLRGFVAKDLVEQSRAGIRAIEARIDKLRSEMEEARREQDAPAAEPAGDKVDFDKQIKPLLEQRCASCHLGRASKGGFSAATVNSIVAGGKSAPAAIAGKSAQSPLIRLLRGEQQPRMPLNAAPLDEASITLIARWIDQLPRKKPAEVLRDGPGAIARTERELGSARAALTALEARIAAEHAKYGRAAGDKEKLAAEAIRAERHANLLESQRNLMDAQVRLEAALAARPPVEREATAAKKAVADALRALEKPADAYSPLGTLHPKVSTGRRLALARWITSRDNPLAARVAVNHIWLRHFGKPLVASMVDFGKNGKTPTHPALLDWLAVEFMESGWSMKKLHRLLVTSRAYRLASAEPGPAHANAKIDRDNVYLWRMNPRRLEAEAVRDSLLAASGALDPAMGGPELNEESAEDTPRRSLYFRLTPSAQLLFTKVFDGPDPDACYARTESIVPQQALALANSTLSAEHARRLAERLGGESGPADEFVRAAFLAVLARPPSPVELTKSLAYLERQASAGGSAARARQSLARALFNRDEFVTIR